MMKRRLTQMGMTPSAAQRRIETVQKRLDEMRFY
jgi:Fe2+ transport system protein FeoA